MKKNKELYEYLYGLEKFGILLGLDNIRIILSLLGNPEKSYPAIHIVGTNGKGSTAAFLTSILSNAGYKVGKYTSPHLVDFSERITINNTKIKEKDIERIAFEISDIIASSQHKDRPYTFFEVTTALAFKYFSEKQVDIAVIEAGLGGRLDATNVLNPIVTIITNIGIEHKDFLGDTIELITKEKAAVIKDSVPVVTCADKIALKIIDDVAKNSNTKVFAINRDFFYKNTSLKKFKYCGIKNDSYDLRLKNLVGVNQFENASLALAATEVLIEKGYEISKQAISCGIENAKWEGRFEYIRKKPPFIIDGAHNPHGVQSLIKNLQTFHPDVKFVFILNVLKDKDIGEMVKTLEPYAEKFLLVPNKNERSHTEQEYKKLYGKRKNFGFYRDISSVVEDILTSKTFCNKPVVFTGSLYGIGEAKEYLTKNHQKIKKC